VTPPPAGAPRTGSPPGDASPAPVAPHIIDAARHVLAQDGLAAATLERISAAAGVSRMTLHRRGVTKQDILRAVAERFESEHREAMWQALVAKGTARERLRMALELQCELTERNLATLEALSALERLLLDGAADGSLARVDAQETATVLFNTVAHTYRHLRSGHGWSPARARDGVLRLVMDGLIAR